EGGRRQVGVGGVARYGEYVEDVQVIEQVVKREQCGAARLLQCAWCWRWSRAVQCGRQFIDQRCVEQCTAQEIRVGDDEPGIEVKGIDIDDQRRAYLAQLCAYREALHQLEYVQQ